MCCAIIAWNSSVWGSYCANAKSCWGPGRRGDRHISPIYDTLSFLVKYQIKQDPSLLSPDFFDAFHQSKFVTLGEHLTGGATFRWLGCNSDLKVKKKTYKKRYFIVGFYVIIQTFWLMLLY